ncbi:MAG: hypothetical protein KDG55_22095 [Rhodocyclaceae bacterium]|nr:hypothetical protein [Rhodocyclaceae bacterium]
MKLQLLRKIWPVVCGLVVGGLLGGLTGSWSIGVLAGVAGCLFFAAQMHCGEVEMPPPRVINPWECPDAGDADQQAALHAYGAGGVGSYAHLYEHPESHSTD